jgi:hypothetical protein
MKNVDELTGAESCVCIYSCCIISHSIFGLISNISFVHSRIFDVVHAGDRNVVTLKRTVDTTWIPEQQAFILTRESSVSNFKLSEALGTLEAISSMFLLSNMREFLELTLCCRKFIFYIGCEIFCLIAKAFVVDLILNKLESVAICFLCIELKIPSSIVDFRRFISK